MIKDISPSHFINPKNQRQLLAKSGIYPKKSWGQNFLCDTIILENLANLSGASIDVPIIELGSGLGALTYYLVKKKAQVIAIERDKRLVHILNKTFSCTKNLKIIEADALCLDYKQLAKDINQKPFIVGNLPYHLASRIMVSLTDYTDFIRGALFTIQYEVAQRASAVPGTKKYGLLSTLLQSVFDIKILQKIPPHVFYPPPKVNSAIVKLVLKEKPISKYDKPIYIQTIRSAFSKKRKMLKNSLAMTLDINSKHIEKIIERAGLEPKIRAESLSIDKFLLLSKLLKESGFITGI